MKAPHHLRRAREQADMTLEEVSAALARSGIELSPGQLSRLERGESGLTENRIDQLARLYGWAPAELIGGRKETDGALRTARLVPLIDSVQAGHWTEVVDPYAKGDAKLWIAAPRRVGPRAFALEIKGNSMEPEYREPDIIIVDPDREPHPGNDVVARIDPDDVATFKRYRQRRGAAGRIEVDLVPLNENWPTLTLDQKKGGRLIGVATDLIRRLA